MKNLFKKSNKTTSKKSFKEEILNTKAVVGGGFGNGTKKSTTKATSRAELQ